MPNKIKTLLLKTTIILSTSMIFVCGSFFINSIKAEETIIIDNTSYTFDSTGTDSQTGLYYVIKNGIKYIIPRWANQSLSSKNIWLKAIGSGVLTINILNSIVGLDYWNKNKYGLDDVIGLANNKIKEGWDSLLNQIDKSTATKKSSLVAKGLLGAKGLVNDVVGGAYDIGRGLADMYSSVQESANKFYYDTYDTINDTLKYHSGNTKYYSVVNDNSSTFYNTYTNTYETINEYHYDYTTNQYHYYTTNNEYITENNYNNTYIFNNNAHAEYELYYELPNGDNSYNLTLDEINGIRTDFNVSNYEINYNDNTMIGLWHLNGNTNNYLNVDNSNIFYSDLNYFPYNVTSYVDSSNGFDLAYMTTSTNLFKLINNDVKNVRFKFYCDSNNATYNLYINPIQYITLNDSTLYDIEINNNNSTEIYVNGISYNINQGNNRVVKFNELPTQSSILVGGRWENGVYICRSSGTGLYEYFYKDIIYSDWYMNDNGLYTFDITCNYCKRRTGYPNDPYPYELKTFNAFDFGNIIITSLRYYDFNLLSKYSLSIDTGISYYTIDELRLGNTALENHNVPQLPYDNSIYYTLPNTDTNNKILIKSNIPVNSFQFGGIRKNVFQSIKGDIYFNLVNNSINSIQQYNGADWISVDGAIYSDTLGKWVNAVGYSLTLGDFNYDDLVLDNGNAETNIFIDLKNSLIDSLNDIKSLITSLINVGDISIPQDNTPSITIPNDSTYSLDISQYIDDVKSADNDIDFNLNNMVGNDLLAVKSLAQNTNTLFDVIEENNLEILYLAPIIIFIVRLVI